MSNGGGMFSPEEVAYLKTLPAVAEHGEKNHLFRGVQAIVHAAVSCRRITGQTVP